MSADQREECPVCGNIGDRCGAPSKCPRFKRPDAILLAALLWLRNHYEVGNPEVRPIVLRRVDKLLESYPVSTEAMERFRKMFPIKAHIESASEQK